MIDKVQSMQVIQAIDHGMMSLDSEAFIRQAYLRLLGRGADADGLKGYLEQLQQGVSREEIYQALATSEEAQHHESRRQMLRKGVSIYAPLVRSTSMAPAPMWRMAAASVSWDEPSTHVADINDLLNLDGVAFIKAAYVALLGRSVDIEGGNFYLQRLRDGWSRMSIVKNLCMSKEGEAFGRRLPSLTGALLRYEKAQRPSWRGWYYRTVLGVESDMPIERYLRATHLALRQS